MALKLSYTGQTSIPVEIEGLTPDKVRGQSLAEIERFEIFHGNRKAALADFFDVSGEPGDGCFQLEGDLAGVHWIGAGMVEGQIRIEGHAGRHLGSEMRGGTIHCHGDAGGWAGAEMRGGLIHIHGSAGHLVGAAYRGSARGMTAGVILVDGDVGNELGHTMRRGLIAVGGACGDMVGFNMIAGNLYVLGSAGIRPGAGMRRGTIGLFGDEPPLLLTFRRGTTYQPLYLRLALLQLRQHGFAVDDQLLDASYVNYHGDFLEGGRGEIVVRA
ncbi:MAG: formylmethanofuran dehydrogenase subunit C [Planctomycetales bacterium]|nr:formylmethanofuran dehydrogenase subunit C [Planctomycetales bacterium]NIM10073.1 formylmethanofuran dehydrogenase subunit C [Planctomycetales bacterium]NIN09514.1 formylmethanofuran dehydrogenase subunit C [Planctomycetales bacterium]NIN78625.1 formylmethanofuran dehydrogenase subunit C [Planctomycetales bacterium]NIO35819.1 formylmethanofuran dehydrogenase subunit C [Planctomycetales bacterium]